MDPAPYLGIRVASTPERVERGWPGESRFVDAFWLPVLGPSSVAVLRWAARHAPQLATHRPVALVDLAMAIGLGRGVGRHAPIRRTLDRLVRFDAACWDASPADGSPALTIHSHLLALPPRLVRHLAPQLGAEHDRAVAALTAAVAIPFGGSGTSPTTRGSNR